MLLEQPCYQNSSENADNVIHDDGNDDIVSTVSYSGILSNCLMVLVTSYRSNTSTTCTIANGTSSSALFLRKISLAMSIDVLNCASCNPWRKKCHAFIYMLWYHVLVAIPGLHQLSTLDSLLNLTSTRSSSNHQHSALWTTAGTQYYNRPIEWLGSKIHAVSANQCLP